jgi:cell division ATPase FtsA
MAKVVVIGTTGDAGLWIVDLGAGTVSPLASSSGELKTVSDLRAGGAVITKGVDFAVVVKSAQAAASGQYDV